MRTHMEIVWTDRARELAQSFEDRAARRDRDDGFVADNYMDLKEHRFFAALVPTELGGEGVGFAEMCELLRIFGGACPSTALALSMHTHLVAANVWKHRRGQDVSAMLARVGAEQPVLVSTGGRDWLESNGSASRVEGGYRVTATKAFASQSAVGELLVTTAPYEDPAQGWRVLHFAVPFTAEGLSVLSDWKTHGMCNTGSNTVRLDNVFVPDAAISLNRPRDGFHPAYNVVCGVALPAIMSVYLGIAQKAGSIAIEGARRQRSLKPHVPAALGEMHNELSAAELAVSDMIRKNDEFAFEAVDAVGQDMVTRKVLATNACIATVTKAMEIVGGAGFYRSFGLERLFRDVQAAKYHPYPEKEQHAFRGEFLLRGGA